MSADKRLFIFAILAFLTLGCIGVVYLEVIGYPFIAPTEAAIAELPSTVLDQPSSPTSTRTPFPTAPPTATRTPIPTRLATQTPEPSPTATRIQNFNPPANYGPSYFPSGINPLTGLHVSDPALLERRPIAIKITNYPRRVRPQSGLNLADIVFEYYIENAITRFIAIFYGNDADRVGPVRSGRFFDEHIIRMFNAIFVFASADKRVLETWQESDLLPMLVLPRPGNCPPLCRDDNDDYNNLYANTAELGPYIVRHGADNNKYDQSGLRFQTIVPWGGDLGMNIFIRYSRIDYNHWQYNAAIGKYERFQETEDDIGKGETYEPMYDQLTGEQINADNVVILYVPHEEFLRSSDTEIVKIHLTGFGPAYVFRDGRIYEATWTRVAEDKPLVILRSGQGSSAFPLKPGRTFFQIIGTSSETIQNGSEWRFNFSIP